MELTKLNDVYSNWATGDGIFTDLNSLNPPWKNEDATENIKTVGALNMAYHGSHSGDKNVSPIVYKFLSSEDEHTRTKLANVIYTMFADKWSKTWDVMKAEYNPLENYNMVETETPAETTHTTTPAETTETVTPPETTETITPPETTETVKPAKTVTENEVSAFNSSSYEDSDKTTVTGDNNDKGTSTIDVDTAGTTKIEVDTAGTTKTEVDTAGSDVFTVQNDRELTRAGNIGVMSSQALATAELELRKWIYYQSVFNDIDSILTLSIY